MKIDSVQDGKFYVKDLETGRLFIVEPLGFDKTGFGDIDPVTKKCTGNYGAKNIGSVLESESVVTEENGFKNIIDIKAGESPFRAIDRILKRKEKD